MAEWTGRKQRQHSPTDPEASHRNQDADDTPQAPQTPGAVDSPQHPGEVPDRSSVPGQYARRVPRATSVRRPLTEYGTAQSIMSVFAAKPGQELEPSRFEQATASYEELRKAYPAQLPPTRPGPGYALQHGDAMASELQAIDAPKPAPSAPAVGSGEAYNAQPGGTAAPPARADAPAAQVGSAFSPSDAPASVRYPADAVAGIGGTGEGGRLGQSRWAEAGDPSHPRPGDPTSLAGELPATREGDQTLNEGSGPPPTVAPQ